MVLLGLFPVLPLKALVARKVIRERMDYEGYLGGRVKEELDGLAGLAGWHVVENAKLEVLDLENGNELSKEAWWSVKPRLPRNLEPFLVGFGSEFCIIEKKGTVKREWELRDINGTTKILHLSKKVLRANGGCHVFEQFVEDGKLIRWDCFYGSKGDLVLSEWDCFSIEEKCVLRTMIWEVPEYNIKITNNMRTRRRYIVMDAANPSPPRSIPDSRPAVSSPSIFSSSPIMTLSSTPPCIPYLNHNVWAEGGF